MFVFRSSTSKRLELDDDSKAEEIPVALIYESPEGDEISRSSRNTDNRKEETLNVDQPQQDNAPSESVGKENRGTKKHSKLLDLEARENDENSKFGFQIQSRNKVPADGDMEELEKPFVYNIQPLSFYSSESKEEENILNYINKIKEMRENQIKFEAQKKKQPQQQNQTLLQKHEEAEVTEADDEVEDMPIRRKIQHYQTVIKPMVVDPQIMRQQGYPVYPSSSLPTELYQQGGFPLQYPQSGYQPNFYPQWFQQSPQAPTPQAPTVVYIPNPFHDRHTTKISSKDGNTRIFDEYFPVLINNPFNEIWAGITNIVEYGPAADVCRKNKKGRDADEENATEIDLSSERLGLGGSKQDTWPKFTKLKVRKGGVAIAGPGGIATAGSGGTAIVGPGGTAYTTREGTAVVGPGGRVVHVPQFPIYAKSVNEEKPREFDVPPRSQVVAEGPSIYFDHLLDPTLPL